MNQSIMGSLFLAPLLFFSKVDALGCDFGPDALTNAYKTPIPQTCIDVPIDDFGTKKERCYYTYVPDSCTSPEKKTVPLVVDIHGLSGCPLSHASYSGWKEKAEEECFAVIWPAGNNDIEDSFGTCFDVPGGLRSDDYDTEGGNDVTSVSCCCGEGDTGEGFGVREGTNDPLFLKMVIDGTIEESTSSDALGVSVDPNRVYMAGHSNGCVMSLAMAALYSDTIAGVACHAGPLLTPFALDYSHVPIWVIHGKKDFIAKYNGESEMVEAGQFYRDSGELVPESGEFGVWSVNQQAEYMAKQNGCKEVKEFDLLDNENGSGKSIGTVYQHTNCEESADVEVVALFESGHFPYDMPPLMQLLVQAMGEKLTTIDTTAMAWEFLSSHNTASEIQEEENTFSGESSALAIRLGKWLGIFLAAPILASFM